MSGGGGVSTGSRGRAGGRSSASAIAFDGQDGVLDRAVAPGRGVRILPDPLERAHDAGLRLWVQHLDC